MGLGIGSELKKVGRSLEKEAKRFARSREKELFRQASDVLSFSTLGMIDPNQMKKARKAEKAAAEEAKRIQLRQRRAGMLENAKLRNEIALRSNIATGGGRFGLLTRTGETGALLS